MTKAATQVRRAVIVATTGMRELPDGRVLVADSRERTLRAVAVVPLPEHR